MVNKFSSPLKFEQMFLVLRSSFKVVSFHFIEFPSLLYSKSDLKAICFIGDFIMNFWPIHYSLQHPYDPAKW